MVADLFRSRTALEMEIWMLRQQTNVLRRTAPKKQTFSTIDRLIFVCLYRLRPGVRDALAIVKPEKGRFRPLPGAGFRGLSPTGARLAHAADGLRDRALRWSADCTVAFGVGRAGGGA
jgi:hypothetical protein